MFSVAFAATLVCAAHATASSPSPSGLPLIFRVSAGGSAAGNDTIIISGTHLAGASARICPLRGGGGCATLPPASSSWEGGLKVTLPPSTTGAFSLAACSSAGCSDTAQAARFVLNAPRVAWVIGDGGGAPSSVATGGVLRIFGASLALDPTTAACAPIRALDARIAPSALPAEWSPMGALAASLSTLPQGTRTTVLLCSGGACAPLPAPVIASCHRLDVVIPEATPPGTYTLRVDNSLASTADGVGVLDREMVVTVFAPAPWPQQEWVVGTDCGIVDCLAAADAAGGGRVLVPAGVWDVPSDVGLILPSRTHLQGVGGGADGPSSTLRWAANTVAGAPSAALTCGSSARVSGLALLAVSPIVVGLHFIAGPGGCSADAVNVTLDVPGAFPIGATFAADSAAGFALTNSLLVHRGNCSRSWPRNTAYTVWGSTDGLIANNTVLCFCQGHSTDASLRIAFDANAVFALGPHASEGSGYSTFESPQVLEHIYEGRRLDVGNPGAVKRYESMTLDGPGGAYMGTVEGLSGNGTDGAAQVITLTTPARAPGPYPGGRNVSSYLGASAAVLYGPGLGALARVAAITPDAGSDWASARVWTLDPPLLGVVPGESFVAINPFRGSMTFEANTFVNATTWQLWAQATEVTLAGSYFQDVLGDVRNWPLMYQNPWSDGFPCAWQANVAVDFVHNTLRCAHALGAVSSDYGATPPANISLGIALTRRNNSLHGGTKVTATGRINDVLIEHTAFADDVCGGVPTPAGQVTIGEGVDHVFVR